MLNKKALAGTAGAPKEYVEDVFSTYLYTGSGASKTITNDIDLSGEGGLVWTKSRSNVYDHGLIDTERGSNKVLFSNLTNANYTTTDCITSFNSNGFTLGTDATLGVANNNTYTYASWTFRKAKKFFDVVTYTGNGSNRAISHNLGSVPGCMIIKRTDTTGNWATYHRSLGNETRLYLNTTDASVSGTSIWQSTTPTSTEFYVDNNSNVNANGGTYVAYLFAHDAGGFGDAGSDNVITCGSYTGNGSTSGPTVTLGYEPQWLMIKASSTTGSWQMIDNMRGMVVSGNDQRLIANSSSAELSNNYLSPTATGFQLVSDSSEVNGSSQTYIYIAIRRGPMKTPTSGTSVFAPSSAFEPSSTALFTGGSFPPDLVIHRPRVTQTWDHFVLDRLRGGTRNLSSASTSAEPFDSSLVWNFDSNTGAYIAGGGSAYLNNAGGTSISYSIKAFRRAPGFFDVVCYTGTGSATTFSHNLGVTPELILIKRRNTSGDWLLATNFGSSTYYASLQWGSTAYATDATYTTSPNGNYGLGSKPTSTVFGVDTTSVTNNNGSTYVAYLFASIPGVSKVFSYTGNGSNQTINCGFTNGARFVMIMRINDNQDAYVWDSARGIVSGNDPHLSLDTTAAEVTTDDSIDSDNTGFIVNQTSPTNINVNTAIYVGIAIA